MAKILIVEDEDEMRNMLRLSLVEHEVLLAANGIDGLLTATREKPDLILLDVNMPGIDGFEVCRRLREDHEMADTPIIFTTTQGELGDRLEGFDAGADDYVTKPFDLTELQMRIRAVLRRSTSRSEDEKALAVAGLTLDLLSRELFCAKGTILLTPTEFSLLEYLMRRAGQLLPTNQILEDVWEYPSGVGDPALVRMHIRNLREKLEEDPSNPQIVRTIGRQGYTIRA